MNYSIHFASLQPPRAWLLYVKNHFLLRVYPSTLTKSADTFSKRQRPVRTKVVLQQEGRID